jgi:hypothetical protein
MDYGCDGGEDVSHSQSQQFCVGAGSALVAEINQ